MDPKLPVTPKQQRDPAAYDKQAIHELERGELPTGFQQMIFVSTWLPRGEKIQIAVSPDTETGLTLPMINKVELLTGRYTTETNDTTPLRLTVARATNGSGGTIQLTRYSATTGVETEILAVAADYDGKARYRAINSDTLTVVGPLFEKLCQNLPTRAAKALLEKGKPNFALIPSVFSTSDPEIKWLQMRSPASRMSDETYENPYRRLYLNLVFPTEGEYHKFLDKMQQLCRKYPVPLMYKFLLTGAKVPSTLRDPKSTKIVFYFEDNDPLNKDGKARAIALAQHIAGSGILNGYQRGKQHRTAVPGRGGIIFADNGIVLAKGTKEERVEVVDMPTVLRMIRAQMLSVV